MTLDQALAFFAARKAAATPEIDAAILPPLDDAGAERARFDALGLALAQGYRDGLWDYQAADGWANDLWPLMLDRLADSGALSQVMHDVYDAFDAGEYSAGDAPGAPDPVVAHTDPAIAAILAAAAGS